MNEKSRTYLYGNGLIQAIFGIYLVFSSLYTYCFKAYSFADITFVANFFAGIMYIICCIYFLKKEKQVLSTMYLLINVLLALSLFTNIIIYLSNIEVSLANCFFLLRYINPFLSFFYYFLVVNERERKTKIQEAFIGAIPSSFYLVIVYFANLVTKRTYNEGIYSRYLTTPIFSIASFIIIYFLSFAFGAMLIYLNRAINSAVLTLRRRKNVKALND